MTDLQFRPPVIVIVGGGASGVLAAAQLLRQSAEVRVVIVEKTGTIGRGLAYSTPLPDHLLNVRASRMSAYADDPRHFLRWLDGQQLLSSEIDGGFAARYTYGTYLSRLLDDSDGEVNRRVQVIEGECVSLVRKGSNVEAVLSDGKSLAGNAAILALGHHDCPQPAFGVAVRPGSAEDAPLDPGSQVLLLGTGLSMADAWLALEACGHHGQIVALSRRGLLPRPHRSARPLDISVDDIPFGAPPSSMIGWLRAFIKRVESEGGDWRDVLDAVRPFNQRIWRSWTEAAKVRFLEHGKAWWDVHRYRISPDIHSRLVSAVSTGRLRIAAARLKSANAAGEAIEVNLTHRGSHREETLTVARIYDCTGYQRHVSTRSGTLVKHLLASGLARPGPLCLGLDVDAEAAIVGADGLRSGQIFAVGPLTKGAFYEIDAVPEIRAQCAEIAKRLLVGLSGPQSC